MAGCGSSSSDDKYTGQNENIQIGSKSVETIGVEAIEPESDVVPEAVDPLMLEGGWMQGCIVGGMKSYRSQFIYKGASVQFKNNIFTGVECETKFSRSQVSADFVIEEKIELLSGEVANKIKYVVNGVEVTYYDSQVISDFNQESLCGIDDWSVGAVKDVFGCEAFKSLWSINKDLVMVEGEVLATGDLGLVGDNEFPERLVDNVFTFREPALLEGEWLKDCTSVYGNQSVRIPVVYTYSSIARRSDYFADSACESIDYSFEYSGSYVVGGETILNSGLLVNELDIAYDSVSLAFHSDFYIVHFNDASYCGFSNWIKGEFKDVTNCEYYSEAHDVKEIYYVEGDELFIGTSSPSGSNSYPDSIDEGYFSRQH